MYFVDRSMALIQPKQGFLDWLLFIEGSDLSVSLEQIRCDCNTFLIPQFEEPEQAVAYIDEIYLSLFKIELSGWYEDPKIWPTDLSLKAFWEMFDITIHSMVIDTVEGELQNQYVIQDEEDAEKVS